MKVDLSGARQAAQMLVGLRLRIARNCVSKKMFQFGEVRKTPRYRYQEPRPGPRWGYVADVALHIECAWRIVQQGRVITGSGDRRVDPDNTKLILPSGLLVEPRDLQEERLYGLLQGLMPDGSGILNVTDLLLVETVEVDASGSIDVHMTGGYCLQVFPERSSDGEAWRLFESHYDTDHFVWKNR